jgi:hypothetical protein
MRLDDLLRTNLNTKMRLLIYQKVIVNRFLSLQNHFKLVIEIFHQFQNFILHFMLNDNSNSPLFVCKYNYLQEKKSKTAYSF